MTTATELICPFCDHAPFKSSQGFTAHTRIKHAGEELPANSSSANLAPEPAREILRDSETGRAVPQPVLMPALTIRPHGISLGRALLRSWWLFMFWLIGPLFSAATLQILPALGPHLIVNGLALLLPLPVFLALWSRRFMPVMRLELNDKGDRYQLRIYYATKQDHGAEGRMQIFGARGYVIDGLEEQDRALDVSHHDSGHVTTTPEGLRYLCDHTPSEERYRRKNSRLAREVIQWGSVTLLIGILVGVTFIVGNIILTDPPTS